MPLVHRPLRVDLACRRPLRVDLASRSLSLPAARRLAADASRRLTADASCLCAMLESVDRGARLCPSLSMLPAASELTDDEPSRVGSTVAEAELTDVVLGERRVSVDVGIFFNFCGLGMPRARPSA